MHTALRLLTVLLLSAAAPTIVHAVVAITPPLRSSQGNNLNCVAQNLGAAAVTVAAEMDNGLGTVVDSGSLSIPPGQALRVAGNNTAIFDGFCRFTFDGDPAAVRGTASREDFGGSDTRLIVQARPVVDTGAAVEQFLATVAVRSSQGNNFGCQIANLSDADVQVISEIQNGLGTVVDSSTITIPAGQVRQGAFTQSAIFSGYCTFHFQAPPDQVRGFATLEPKGGGDTLLIVEAEPIASPAAPTPTATAPSSPTPTATGVPIGGCCGDCDGTGEVTINELITAVNNALNGCPIE
ncbi:MAG: hypothetical protein SF182_21700 [Deltaproteobacteria bacterium]|nr:hypothetical protein [Deltaproteobacteria bacterium]